MYYVMRAFAPSLHRESTDSLIYKVSFNEQDSKHCLQFKMLEKTVDKEPFCKI